MWAAGSVVFQADFDMLYNRLEEWRKEQEKSLHEKKDQSTLNKGR